MTRRFRAAASGSSSGQISSVRRSRRNRSGQHEEHEHHAHPQPVAPRHGRPRRHRPRSAADRAHRPATTPVSDRGRARAVCELPPRRRRRPCVTSQSNSCHSSAPVHSASSPTSSVRHHDTRRRCDRASSSAVHGNGSAVRKARDLGEHEVGAEATPAGVEEQTGESQAPVVGRSDGMRVPELTHLPAAHVRDRRAPSKEDLGHGKTSGKDGEVRRERGGGMLLVVGEHEARARRDWSTIALSRPSRCPAAVRSRTGRTASAP